MQKQDDKVAEVEDEQKVLDADIDNGVESDDSADDPDETFQAIRAMLRKPSKLARKVICVHDRLYLGGRKEILDVAQLADLSMTHILHCAELEENEQHDMDHTFWTQYLGDSFVYFGFAAKDERKYDMLGQHWSACKAFLEETLEMKGARVLIACRGGANRSCTILAAALMHFYEMDAMSACKAIHDQKFPVLTNNSFVKQIVEMDRQRQK